MERAWGLIVDLPEVSAVALSYLVVHYGSVAPLNAHSALVTATHVPLVSYLLWVRQAQECDALKPLL